MLVHTDPGKSPETENQAAEDLRKRQVTLVGQLTEFIKGNIYEVHLWQLQDEADIPSSNFTCAKELYRVRGGGRDR